MRIHILTAQAARFQLCSLELCVPSFGIGGKYNDQIVFRGNRKFLPVGIRRIINLHFNKWNSMADISAYPEMLRQLGEAEAGPYLQGTDWDGLHKLYQTYMERFTLVLHGRLERGSAPRFAVSTAHGSPARPLAQVLAQYTDKRGVLHDSFDIWRLEKLLRRSRAQLRMEPTFQAALQRFAADAISFEESLSFFRQVQAYHDPRFLKPEFAALLGQHIDAVHTLRLPQELPELAAALRELGAHVRVHESTKAVLEHAARVTKLCAVGEEASVTGADLPVEQVLRGKLKAEPYPFQREGVAHLVGNRRALLADDMGLGKTLQAIAATLYLRETGKLRRALVVCPASLKYQWQAEVARFTGLRCEVIAGSLQQREDIYRAARSLGSLPGAGDLPVFYVINYELVHRDIDQLKKLEFDVLILDEAQRVKNFRTKTAASVFQLQTPYLFVLTGTPLENQLMELFTIMRFVDERALGKNPITFRDRYVVTDRFGGITGYRLVEEVTRKISSLTLRRTKEQALDQLPAMIQMERWLDLTDVQRQIYRELHGQARSLLSQAVWDQAGTNNAMVLLQRLREVCDSPELIDPAYKESQKLAELQAILEDEVQTLDRQAIIFTQWTRMGEILQRELQAWGFDPLFLHGGVAGPERNEMVQQFQGGRSRILISTDAGGTGLNLQAASLVVNFDLPFNPAKLAQRVARAHRLGQESTVVVMNLLCRATIEEKLVQILQEKQALFDDIFGELSDQAQLRLATAHQRSLRELYNDLLA